MALAIKGRIMYLNFIASNGFKVCGSRLWHPLSCTSVKFYSQENSSGSKSSMFYQTHSLEVLEKKKKMLLLEDPKPREKIEYEAVNIDWKVVERLMAPKTVPDFPKFAKYPSGWQPPNTEKTKDLPYNVRRTRVLNFPVFFESRNGHARHITKVCYIEGDIWAFEKDLRVYLEEIQGSPVPTQIHEAANFVRFRGDFYKDVIFWLMDKGF
ncbi:54S ribosomal protein L49, mitochondrial [Chamberlinius hualienensis]